MGALTLPALDGQSITTTSPRVYPSPQKTKPKKKKKTKRKQGNGGGGGGVASRTSSSRSSLALAGTAMKSLIATVARLLRAAGNI